MSRLFLQAAGRAMDKSTLRFLFRSISDAPACNGASGSESVCAP